MTLGLVPVTMFDVDTLTPLSKTAFDARTKLLSDKTKQKGFQFRGRKSRWKRAGLGGPLFSVNL